MSKKLAIKKSSWTFQEFDSYLKEKTNIETVLCIPLFAKLFEIPQMVGIIWGRGKFGLYFVGNQKDNLILLDPHFNQETVEKIKKLEKAALHKRTPIPTFAYTK